MIRDFDLLSFLKFYLLITYLKHRISESKQSIFFSRNPPVLSLQNDIFNLSDTCRPSNVSIIYLLLLNIKLRTVNVIK